MSSKFLTRVVAGAAFGSACMLIGLPGVATADDHRGHDHHDRGWVYTHPKHVEAGEKVYIVQICKDPQEKPWVKSEVTGKVWLKPKGDHDHHHDRDGRHHDDKKGDRHHDDKKGDRHHDDKGDKKGDRHHDDKKDGRHHDKHDKKGDKDHPFAYFAKVKIPKHTEPGTYDLKGSCAEGEMKVVPNGWVDGGDGGSGTTSQSGLLAGGVGMLAAAGIGGVLLRRRTADGTLV